jgi:hypothetical protein
VRVADPQRTGPHLSGSANTYNVEPPSGLLVPETSVEQPLEVRLICSRDCGFGPREPSLVLGTNHFRELVVARHIGQGRGPRRREDALVFNRHMELRELAPVGAD